MMEREEWESHVRNLWSWYQKDVFFGNEDLLNNQKVIIYNIFKLPGLLDFWLGKKTLLLCNEHAVLSILIGKTTQKEVVLLWKGDTGSSEGYASTRKGTATFLRGWV